MIDLCHEFEEVELIYKQKRKAKDRPSIKSCADAFNIFRKTWSDDQINLVEEAKIMLLDRRLRVMSIASISKGGMSGTIVDPKIIFSIALKRAASSFIIAHNHPSGNLNPSKADIEITKKLIKGGDALDLPLNDHLIITDEDYNSILNDADEELKF